MVLYYLRLSLNSNTSMAIDRERTHYVDYLRDHGHRVTAERIALFEEIYSHHDHIDADEIHSSMVSKGAKISRATVYRNLDLLVETGLVRKSRLGQARYLYEHVHLGQEHDHLVCSACGRVVELVGRAISVLQGEVCRSHGFDPNVHRLQIHGICGDCTHRRDEASVAVMSN